MPSAWRRCSATSPPASPSSPSAPRLLGGTGRADTHLLIVATSERGLCGGFNSSIVRLARAHATRLLAEGKTVKILTVGKKGREQLRRDLGRVLVGHVDLGQVRRIGYGDASAIAHDVLHRFDAGEFDVATIFYNRFQSVISQVPTARQLIPAVFEAGGRAARSTSTSPTRRRSSPTCCRAASPPRSSPACSRTAPPSRARACRAMDNATRNAGDMIDRLTIVYNRSRQAAITKELIEIISGAEAL